MDTAVHKILEALHFMSKDKWYDYLKLQPEGNIQATFESIGASISPKLNINFLADASIKDASHSKENCDHNIEKMLYVSAKLMRKELNSPYSSKKEWLIELSLSLFNFIHVSDGNRGTFSGLLRDCGKCLDRQELQKIINKIGSIVADKAKCAEARNLLCIGYLEENKNAELAFLVLDKDSCLSTFTNTTPDYEIIENFKKVLKLVDVNNPETVRRAKALFFRVCCFPGEKQAKNAVFEVRPDLVGELYG